MGLGRNKLGDLNQYSSKKEIQERLQELESTRSKKHNDAAANFEFVNEIKPKDIIINNKRNTLLNKAIVLPVLTTEGSNLNSIFEYPAGIFKALSK